MSDLGQLLERYPEAEQKLRDPILRRLVENEIRRGRGTEIYRLDADDTEGPIYFDVSTMREWAEGRCEVFALPVDFERAEKLLESGAVDQKHLRNTTIRKKMKPIIVCRGLRGGDQIVDGAHTFVAICMGAAYTGFSFPVPAYVLLPRQWNPFVIPQRVIDIMEMGERVS